MFPPFWGLYGSRSLCTETLLASVFAWHVLPSWFCAQSLLVYLCVCFSCSLPVGLGQALGVCVWLQLGSRKTERSQCKSVNGTLCAMETKPQTCTHFLKNKPVGAYFSGAFTRPCNSHKLLCSHNG